MATTFFNSQFYLSKYPDVKAAVEAGLMSAEDHFNLFGKFEERSPNPVFDPVFYLAQNPDIATALEGSGVSAFDHFAAYGFNEARAIHPTINLGDYLTSNPDVAAAVAAGEMNAFDHLMSYGLGEPRDLGNGVNLGAFANDPTFQEALESGDLSVAAARVAEVAPFIPTFKSPAGWTPPADLPIPTSFVPVEGETLVVPEGVKVPEDVELPDFIKPAAPVEPTPPVDEGGSTSPTTPKPDPEPTAAEVLEAAKQAKDEFLSDALNNELVANVVGEDASTPTKENLQAALKSVEETLQITPQEGEFLSDEIIKNTKDEKLSTIQGLETSLQDAKLLYSSSEGENEALQNKVKDYEELTTKLESEKETRDIAQSEAITSAQNFINTQNSSLSTDDPDRFSLDSELGIKKGSTLLAKLEETEDNNGVYRLIAQNDAATTYPDLQAVINQVNNLLEEMDAVTKTQTERNDLLYGKEGTKDEPANGSLMHSDSPYKPVLDAKWALSEANADLETFQAAVETYNELVELTEELNKLEKAVEDAQAAVDAEEGDGKGEDEPVEFSDSIENIFEIEDNAVIVKDGLNLDSYTLTGGTLDISDLKGEGKPSDGFNLDLSNATIAAGSTVTVKLAELENGNKGDLNTAANGGVKSDQSVKLPSLENIKGTLVIENMTIASDKMYEAARYSDDTSVRKFTNDQFENAVEPDNILRVKVKEIKENTDESTVINYVEVFLKVKNLNEDGSNTYNLTKSQEALDGYFDKITATKDGDKVIIATNDSTSITQAQIITKEKLPNDILSFGNNKSDIKNIEITRGENNYLNFKFSEKSSNDSGSIILKNLISQNMFLGLMGESDIYEYLDSMDTNSTINYTNDDAIKLIGILSAEEEGTFVFDA